MVSKQAQVSGLVHIVEPSRRFIYTYRDLELTVVEEESSVGANELVLLGSGKSRGSDFSHFL